MSSRSFVPFLTTLAAFLLAGHHQAAATEGAGTSYITGFQTVNLGIIAQPGVTWQNFDQFYVASSFRDSDGNKLWPTYEINTELTSQRFDYTLPMTFDAFKVGFIFIVPYQTTNLKKSINGIRYISDERRGGLGDVKFSPINLGWGADTDIGRIDENVRFFVSAPTGSYNPSAPFNIGRNYWSFWANWGQNWQPNENWQIGFMTAYILNEENPATHYLSGDEVEIDYSASYRVTPDLWVDLQGCYYAQVTGDRKNGVAFVVANDPGTGFEGRVFSIGPQIRYKLADITIILKWQSEVMAENHPQGNRFWLQLAVPLF